MDPELDEKIRAYWEDPDTRSLIDRNLRRLEEAVVRKYLEPGFELLDVGCGDGASTLTYARQVKRCVGLERSDHLREKAAAAVAEAGLQNVEILAGDVLELEALDEPAVACYPHFRRGWRQHEGVTVGIHDGHDRQSAGASVLGSRFHACFSPPRTGSTGTPHCGAYTLQMTNRR